MQNVEIFTNGHCQDNPSTGNWSVLILGDQVQDLKGTEDSTTPVRITLTAIIEGLKALNAPCNICMYTDSRYGKNTITERIAKGKKDNWKESNGSPIKDRDLWIELDSLVQKHQIAWN